MHLTSPWQPFSLKQGQAIDKYMVQYGMTQQLSISNEERIHILIAAYAHDSGHQGLSNNFYISTEDNLALKYSNMSPLQHMHSANLLQCIRLHSIQVPKQLKQLMVTLILATDNKHHFELVQKLQDYQKIVNNHIIQHLDDEDRSMGQKLSVKFRQPLLQMMIHTADINVCGKPLAQYLKWNDRLYEEFKIQHNKQTQLNLAKHTFDLDLKNLEFSVCSSNLGFFNKMVLPLFKQVGIIMPKFKPEVMNAVKIKDYLQEKIKELNKKQSKKV